MRLERALSCRLYGVRTGSFIWVFLLVHPFVLESSTLSVKRHFTLKTALWGSNFPSSWGPRLVFPIQAHSLCPLVDTKSHAKVNQRASSKCRWYKSSQSCEVKGRCLSTGTNLCKVYQVPALWWAIHLNFSSAEISTQFLNYLLPSKVEHISRLQKGTLDYRMAQSH